MTGVHIEDHAPERDQAYGLDRSLYLRTLLDSFSTLIGYDTCVLLRETGGVFVVEGRRGDGVPVSGFHVAATEMPEPGVHRAAAPPWSKAMTGSWLLASIEADGKWIEWVVLGRRKANGFTDRDCMETGAIARLAGHVFGNEAIQADMEEQLRRFSILIKIGQVLSSSLDLNVLLEKVYEEVGRFFDTTNFYIALSRPESLEFVIGISTEHGEREIDGATYPIGNGLTGYIILTAKPLFLPVFSEQQAFLASEGVSVIGELPKSWMGVPLIAGDMVVGVMAIQSYEREGVYSRADLELFLAIASQIAVAVRNAQLYEDAERRARETSAISAIGRDVSSTLDLETVLGRIVSSVRELMTKESAAIFLTEENSSILSAVVVSGEMESMRQSLVVEHGKGMLGSIVENAKAEMVNDVSTDPRAFHIAGTEDEQKGEKFMAAPLFSQGHVIGAIAVWRGPGEPAFTKEDLTFLEGIGQQASIAIRNAQLFSQTMKLATTDGLTGLLNRRCFTERLDGEYIKTKRYGRPTSIIMADVDHFKKVNDTYGHAVGDAVLRILAQVLTESVRNCDFAGRYGGEEFVLLLPETAVEGARTLAERIRERVAAKEILLPEGGVFSVTASFGVAGVRQNDLNHEEVLKRADQALYHSKEQGRNRVSIVVNDGDQ